MTTSRSKTPPEAVDAGIVLMRLADQRDRLENEILGQVQDVIRLGGSWTTVSVALGVTKQAAWERYRIRPGKFQNVDPDDTAT